jgi:hypothetical protein
MDKYRFTKGVEQLVDPIEVGSIHFMQFFNNLMPKSIQKKLVENSSSKTSSMGFIIDPYAYFLCYEITNIEYAKELLPRGFSLVKAKIFEDDEPKYYSIFGCVNARTSAFLGLRVEFYIMAEDDETGLLSWIIIDYDSNTISYDKKKGLSNPNASASYITTHYDGTLVTSVVNKEENRSLIFNSDIKDGVMKPLDQRLWLEGNLSIGYGKNIVGDNKYIFSLKFDPNEVKEALEIPLSSLDLKVNNWYKDLYKETPAKLVCFPYAQHFISDSPGFSSNIKNKEELIKAVESTDFSKIQVIDTKIFKYMFLVGSITSFIVTMTLLILLILK